MKKEFFELKEACDHCHTTEAKVLHYIEQEWLKPLDSSFLVFDEEDEARIRLIQELEQDFEVNEEAISLILHLLDQLNGVLEFKRN